IIDIFYRMSDARVEGRELLKRLLPCRRIHPCGALNLVLQRSEDVVDELVHLPVALGGIMALHVNLPDAFAERAVDEVDAAFPPRPLSGNVAQGFRIEVEPRVIERLGKILRIVADEMD